MVKISSQKYINSANEHLKLRGMRLLTVEEQAIIIKHLLEVANDYDSSTSKFRDLMSMLCLETAKKVSEIHPGIEAPTEEQIKLGEARVSKEFDQLLSLEC